MNLTQEQLNKVLKDNPDISIDSPATPKIKAERAVQPKQVSQQGKRRTVIKMPYLGCVITENHYLGRNGKSSYVKPEAAEWANDLIFLINRCGIKDWKLPLKVTVSGTFKNGRERPDLHNFKILYDAIQKATGLNDKDYHTETIPGEIDKTTEPYILITIAEL